jgi:hypothetical protein
MSKCIIQNQILLVMLDMLHGRHPQTDQVGDSDDQMDACLPLSSTYIAIALHSKCFFFFFYYNNL